MDDLTIADVRRLRLAPGDTLVLRMRNLPSHAQLDGLVGELRSVFPDNRALILDEDTDLEVLSREMP